MKRSLLVLWLSLIIVFTFVSMSHSEDTKPDYEVTQLTDNAYDDEYPLINDNGFVVWNGYDGSDYEIFLYDGTSTTQLTNNSYFDGYP